MTVHPFPPMGKPRNTAEEIANARAALDRPQHFEPLNDDPEPVSLLEWLADAAGVILLFVMIYGVLMIGAVVMP